MASNDSFTMEAEKAASQLQSINGTFRELVNSVNNMVQDLTDLQTNFYSPAGKDSTLIYEECAKNIGVGQDKGLYPAIKGAHQWCSAVDQYVQDKIHKASNGNPYDD